MTAGDRVQVYNPHALAVGDRTWSQTRLLRVLETARQRGLD